jgi:RHS repeat-associated protein
LQLIVSDPVIAYFIAYGLTGNLIDDGLRTLAGYTAFNLPSSMTGNGMTLTYAYDTDHQRVTETVTGGSKPGTTTYVGQSYFEVFTPQGASAPTQWKHYIGSPEGIVATLTDDLPVGASTNTLTNRFWAKDHLGSIVAEYDEGGGNIQRFSFDAWGKRRNADGSLLSGAFALPANIASASSQCGFTGHEMLDEVGLAHMNGRIYDPLIGRFMQADPIIQDPYLSQSYNRYSYVLNNPLSYTDPSGFSWWTTWRRPIFALIAAIVVPQLASYLMEAAAAGGSTTLWTAAIADSGGIMVTSGASAGLSAGGSAIAAMAGGFAAGGISGGNLQSAISGAFAALASFGVGEAFDAHGANAAKLSGGMKAGHVAAHAAVGCASSAVAGGNCTSGALAQGFSALAGHVPELNQTGLIGRIAVGGIASKLAGGKFASGALSAAFEYLYNYCSGGVCTSGGEQIMYDWWPGYKFGTGLSNSYDAGSLKMTGEETLDGVFSLAAGVGKIVGATASVKSWWNLGKEGDAAFKTLSLNEKIVTEIGKKTISAANYAEQAGMTALEAGYAEIKRRGGMLKALFHYDFGAIRAFGTTASTGPTATIRIYFGNGVGITWFGVNSGATVSR